MRGICVQRGTAAYRAIFSLAIVACVGDARPREAVEPAERNEDSEQPTEIRLDWRPFAPIKEPTGAPTFVLIDDDGNAQAVRYSPSRLLVISLYQRALPANEVSQLFERVTSDAFRRALKGRFAGSGVEDGDLFSVQISGGGRTIASGGGLVHKAPHAVQTIVKDLLAVSERLDKRPLAEAYVRSTPIPNDRFESLKRAGKLRFLEIVKFPEDLQPVIRRVVARPSDFHPLTYQQYEKLLPFCSHGHNLYVVQEESGHEFALFTAHHVTEQQEKGDLEP